MKIISGGQTGADLGALFGAREAGFETGGTAPMGWYNEDGKQETLFKSFGMTECMFHGYPARSMKNVDDSDMTIAIVWDRQSIGTMKTLGYAQTGKWQWAKIPYPDFENQYRLTTILNKSLHHLIIRSIKQYIEQNNIHIINVCGHRESSQPGIQEFAAKLIMSLK